MSDGITDSYRDQRRAECFEDFLSCLADHLEQSSDEKISRLLKAASETDQVPRGLMSGRTNLSEGLSGLLEKLLAGDEQTWGNLLMTAHGGYPDKSFYRLKKVSPFKDKILLKMDYGIGFVSLHGDFQNFLDKFVGSEKNLKIYDGDSYLVTISKEAFNGAGVVWLKSGISGVKGPRKARE